MQAEHTTRVCVIDSYLGESTRGYQDCSGMDDTLRASKEVEGLASTIEKMDIGTM